MKPLLSHILMHGIDEQTPVEQLELALEEHPYSSTLAVLLTKAYTERNDVRFEHMLNRSALLTQQRKNLHAFVYQMMQAEPDTVSTTTEAPEPDSLPESDLTTTEQAPTASPVESTSEASKPETVRTTESEETDLQEETETKRISRDPDELLTQQYMSEALASGVLSELYKADAEAETEGIEEDSPSVESKEEAAAIEENTATKAEAPADSPKAAPDKLGFSAWMSFLSDDVAKEETTSTSKTTVPASEDEMEVPRPSESTKSKTNPPKQREDLSAIIDRFIEQEDDIVPKRASFFSPEKAAKASLKDNDTIVTETLARIYAEQGNVSKAIDTYEKLRLRHPEKSSYFAALIQKLKSD